MRVSDIQLRTGPWRSVHEYICDAFKYTGWGANEDWSKWSTYREFSTMSTVVRRWEEDVHAAVETIDLTSNMAWLDRRVDEMRVKL